MKTYQRWLILLWIAFLFLVSCEQTQEDSGVNLGQEGLTATIAIIDRETRTTQPSLDLITTDQRNDPESTLQKTTAIATLKATSVEDLIQPELDMLRIEKELWSLGYVETGLVDGIFDQQTILAIKHLQWLNGLPITGEVTQGFYENLIGGALLGVSAQPPFPAKSLSMYTAGFMLDGFLKGRLVDLGYLDSADPSFDPFDFDEITDQAVKAFQKQNNLTANGVVDFKVWQTLFHPSVKNASGEPLVQLPELEENWITSFFPILDNPIDLTYDGKYIWVLHSSGESAFDNLLLRIDPNVGLLDQSPPVMVGDLEEVDSEIVQMVSGGNRIWLLLPQSFDPPELINLIPETAEVFYRTTFADCQDEGCFPAYALGYDGNKVWATVDNRAWGINRSNGKGYQSQQIGWLSHGEMAFDGHCMWMGSEVGLTTFHTGGLYHCPAEEFAYSLPSGPVIFDGQRIWVADEDQNLIYWLDIDSEFLGDAIPVGDHPSALVFDGKTLWVANKGDNTILGIDVNTGSVGETLNTGQEPVAMVYDGKRVWVANAGDRTLQAIDINDYVIDIIQPTQTPIPSSTPTKEPTASPTISVFTRNLYLQDSRMKGEDVLILQQRLLDLGYVDVGLPDGIFGPNTDLAVRFFQEINKLVVDGIVGSITWDVLFSNGAKGP